MSVEQGIISVQQPLNRTQSPYPDDTTGELCDAWVRAGDAFVMHAGGDHEMVPGVRLPEVDDTPAVYNPALLTEMTDLDGREILCATDRDYRRHSYSRMPLSRLMMELPDEQLILRKKRPDEPVKYPRPDRQVALGIRLDHLAQARGIVRSAYTYIPKGTGRYPEGALVLSGWDRRSYLDYFDAVLSPPPPAKLDPPPAPPPQPAQQPSPTPEADKWATLEVGLGKGLLIGATAVGGACALETIRYFMKYGNEDPGVLGVLTLMTALCGTLAVIGYKAANDSPRE